MLSSHKFLLVMVELEGDPTIEVDEEIIQEVEEPIQQIQVEVALSKIQVIISLMVKGMTNIKFNVITTKGMSIMDMSVEKYSLISASKLQTFLEKIRIRVLCF